MHGTRPSKRLRLATALWSWEPHPTQREWLECDAQVKVAACGRRWGKTESAAVDAATLALLAPGSVQIVVSPTYDQSRLIFGHVERLLLQSRVTRPAVNIARTPYPRLSVLGSVIMARTADEDGRNLRGHSADRVIVDEAAYVRDSVVAEVIMPMLADRAGRLVMISTPFGKNHFYRAFVKGQGPGQYASFCFPSWTNPHISADYVAMQRNELSSRQFAIEYEARFLDDESSVFAWREIEAAAKRGDRRGSAADRFETVAAGIDWARYTDYTAAVAVGVDADGCHVIAIDRFNRMGWDDQVRRVVRFLREHRVESALADQTASGDVLLEMIRRHLWQTGAEVIVEGYQFTNQSKRDLIEGLAARFSQGNIFIPRDEALIRELEHYEYELTSSGNVRMNARTGCHDDLVIALALACRQASHSLIAGGFLVRGRRAAAGAW